MKIGIITAYNAYNYGAILQAIALKKALQKLGHTVRFIETFTNIESSKQYFYSIKVKKNNDWKFLLKKYILFKKIHKRFNPISVNKINYDTFDIVIIGSDELWNLHTPIFSEPLHTRGIFYGESIKCNHIITYAVSSGDTKANEYKQYPKNIKNMKKLTTIMVRDSITQKNIHQLIGKKCSLVMDPTFLIKIKNLRKESNYIKEPYILVYAYFIPDKIRINIERYAIEHNYKIISVGTNYKWADKNILCFPLEFNDIVLKSKAVITTTFHGTIFSILNHKKFVSLPISPKTEELLSTLNMESHSIIEKCSYADFKNKLHKNINYYKLDNKIKTLQKDSLKKLKDALNTPSI